MSINDMSAANVTADVTALIAPLPPLAVVDGQCVNVSGISDAVARIEQRLSLPQSFMVCTVNLDHLVKRRQDPGFLKAYQKAEIASADGFPIAALARLDGFPIERAPGADLVLPLCERAAAAKIPVFLVGPTLRTLCLSAKRLVSSCPDLEICGVYAPPPDFDSQSEAASEMISIIGESGAKICFVALGAPRQELFAARAIEETSNIAFIGVGGGLDFIAGTQIRCPPFVRRLYLEWAWRLILNPRRLAIRYFRCAILLLTLFARTAVHRRPLATG
ncbi:WecB/TagA/CpsF family glycosyltransferase [Bradyrhizobium sp. BR13661]|jgi:N-acetylglucosaminyldiphosphoundecaprenol N-acetyl-beta-D-mannosaminyltransferase|uniref:WecB/TagA/CpsF family glycosyltransferase n=1 Tax=Bradyrhizobium sp. BR13661 TaxID=2940622 RepID=UPI002476BE63|nr:WecB/TagA/CpsF family glycosyltransferase [Bradyrhizobium sp. BR13661]MDH6263550.1 N-acetylglucosaminyldiphosphoundecaprenol N-acetyl-beta-D-mannosaminyltransferase [Bradyrhizobium sp. BR13661]